MSLPEVATREEWLEARRALLAREKAFTRQMDTLNADRRRLRRAFGRAAGAPRRPGHGLRRRGPGPLREDRHLQGETRLDVPLLLVARQRLPLRLPRHHRRVEGAAGGQLPHPGRPRGPGGRQTPLDPRAGAAVREPGLQLLPARRRGHLPHQFDVRPGHRGVQRLLRHPRPHGARSADEPSLVPG